MSTPRETSACQHCPDGHAQPGGRPWAAFVASERDGDGQPTHLYIAPTAGQHVAESDAAWVRRLLNLAQHRDDIARDTCPGNHAALGTEHVPHADMGCQWSEQHTDAVLALFKEDV